MTLQETLKDPKNKLTAAIIIVLIVIVGAIGQINLYENNKKTVDLHPVEIITSEKSIKLALEVADEPQEQAQGLMFKKEIPENGGMLFIFNGEEVRSFWMKNTFVSLDMIFINSDFEIVHIEKNAKPLNDKIFYSSKLPAKYVIEVNAGFAEANYLQIGDKVVF